ELFEGYALAVCAAGVGGERFVLVPEVRHLPSGKERANQKPCDRAAKGKEYVGDHAAILSTWKPRASISAIKVSVSSRSSGRATIGLRSVRGVSRISTQRARLGRRWIRPRSSKPSSSR